MYAYAAFKPSVDRADLDDSEAEEEEENSGDESSAGLDDAFNSPPDSRWDCCLPALFCSLAEEQHSKRSKTLLIFFHVYFYFLISVSAPSLSLSLLSVFGCASVLHVL